MIDEPQIKEIFAQYKKHGWNLRRVLLSAELSEKISVATFGQAEVIVSEFNAAWFSRFSAENREAWELRHLSATPFALVEVFEDEDEEEVREEARSEMETQLKEKASKVGGLS